MSILTIRLLTGAIKYPVRKLRVDAARARVAYRRLRR